MAYAPQKLELRDVAPLATAMNKRWLVARRGDAPVLLHLDADGKLAEAALPRGGRTAARRCSARCGAASTSARSRCSSRHRARPRCGRRRMGRSPRSRAPDSTCWSRVTRKRRRRWPGRGRRPSSRSCAVAAGKVVTSGNPKRLRYAASRGRTGDASGTTAKRKPAGSTSKKTTKATPTPQPRAAAPSFATQADYDAAVLSTIRGAGDRLASSAIQTRVGGSIDAVRAALQRLVAAGQVVRVGERKLTRYGVAGQS